MHFFFDSSKDYYNKRYHGLYSFLVNPFKQPHSGFHQIPAEIKESKMGPINEMDSELPKVRQDSKSVNFWYPLTLYSDKELHLQSFHTHTHTHIHTSGAG
jgi:hypothetical protein